MKTLSDKDINASGVSLLCILPQYCRLTPAETDALISWQWAGQRTDLAAPILERYDEKWLMAACRDVRDAALMADKWLYVDITALYQQNLKGLNDFALATYAGALVERDSETMSETVSEVENNAKSSCSWKKLCDTYWQLLANTAGSVLLNYSWLFNDMIQLGMVEDDAAMTQLHDMALAFELKRGTPAGLMHVLLLRAVHLLQTGRIDDGTALMGRVIANHPDDFNVYEAAATAFFQNGEWSQGHMVLDAAHSLPKSSYQLNRYRDMRVLYDGAHQACNSQIPEHEVAANERLRHALHALHRRHPGGDEMLARKLVPGIDDIFVKQFRL